MASEKQLNEVLDKIATDASGFIAASLVDLDSGMTLAIKASPKGIELRRNEKPTGPLILGLPQGWIAETPSVQSAPRSDIAGRRTFLWVVEGPDTIRFKFASP